MSVLIETVADSSKHSEGGETSNACLWPKRKHSVADSSKHMQ